MMAKKQRLVDPATLQIEPLDADAAYKAAVAELAVVEKRLAAARERRQQAQARMRGVRSSREVLARAGDLIRGGKIPPAAPADEIRAADEEADVLRAAIIKHNERVAEARAEASYKACLAVREHHQAALREVLRSSEDLAVAVRAIAGLHVHLIRLGYEINTSALPCRLPPAALALGDPHQVGVSQAWQFAEGLRKDGII